MWACLVWLVGEICWGGRKIKLWVAGKSCGFVRAFNMRGGGWFFVVEWCKVVCLQCGRGCVFAWACKMCGVQCGRVSALRVRARVCFRVGLQNVRGAMRARLCVAGAGAGGRKRVSICTRGGLVGLQNR